METKTLELTDEQVRKVEDNHNLIFSFMHKHKLPEDMYSTVGMGLCKAAGTFDESRGTAFSTYAYVCMYNECRKVWQHERRQMDLNPISLDEPQMGDEDLCLMDMLEGKNQTEEIETCTFLEWFIKDAATPDLFIILRLLQRETQVEIAKEMGCTKARVGARVQKIRARYQERRPLKRWRKNEDTEQDRHLRQEIIRTMRCDLC